MAMSAGEFKGRADARDGTGVGIDVVVFEAERAFGALNPFFDALEDENSSAVGPTKEEEVVGEATVTVVADVADAEVGDDGGPSIAAKPS